MVEYTRGATNGVKTLDTGYIADCELAIHGITGAQLFDPNKDALSMYGVVYLFPLNVGDGEFTCSSNLDRNFDGKNTAAYLFIAGGKLETTSSVSTAINGVWDGNDRTVESVDGYITIAARKSAEVNPFVGYEIMVNRGSNALPYEPYNGGTPYTDKYAATITDQTENNVTLSIENVSASEGENTGLDVVLTDIFGVTKRSEVSKTFIGGGEST